MAGTRRGVADIRRAAASTAAMLCLSIWVAGREEF